MVDSGVRSSTMAMTIALAPIASAGMDHSGMWVRVSHALATLLAPVAG